MELENKLKIVNFDKLISENGLAIIHEAKSSGSSTNKFKVPNHRRGESGYFISIEQRDGKYETQNYARNISGDLYQEGHEFSPYTVPSSVSRSAPGSRTVSRINFAKPGGSSLGARSCRSPFTR